MSRRLPAVLVGLHLLPIPAPAQDAGGYEPYGAIIRGTDGAHPVVLHIRNAGASDLACTAALAHWYSEKLGRAAPGAAIEAVLWHDPETGVINLLNAETDRMPVEALWCGTPGGGATGRARLSLPLASGPAPARLVFACAPQAADGHVACPLVDE